MTIAELVATQTSATIGFVDLRGVGVNWVGNPPSEPQMGDVWFDPVKSQSYIWSANRRWELFMTQPEEVKARYLICRYCGRPLARNKGDHSCDGCGSALEA